MEDQVYQPKNVDAAMKTVSSAKLIGHIVERRIEYLLGTLIAYQLGLLDTLVSNASQCLV